MGPVPKRRPRRHREWKPGAPEVASRLRAGAPYCPSARSARSPAVGWARSPSRGPAGSLAGGREDARLRAAERASPDPDCFPMARLRFRSSAALRRSCKLFSIIAYTVRRARVALESVARQRVAVPDQGHPRKSEFARRFCKADQTQLPSSVTVIESAMHAQTGRMNRGSWRLGSGGWQ